ncbi:MAG: sigma-54 dependent transcriptional regulator [Immundisolibacteraceae bacterium]|nr:sigma-54 dependent transcriptional regulator [Immundisolibacteraceae bacterium]
MPQQLPFYCIIADTDEEHCSALISVVEEVGFDCLICKTTDELKEMLNSVDDLGFAFLSLDLIDEENLALLKHPQLTGTDIAIIHTEDDPEAASAAIKQGATYFFCKPLNFQFVSDLLSDLKVELSEITQNQSDGLNVCSLDQFGLLRGSSKIMYKLYRTLRKVAVVDTSVLLVGESGTGKELAAQTIHQQSERCDGPFIAMNCGAIPPELVESELFGHEKGSFSGADKQRIGYFEQAAGGTLFLDEIGEMPMDTQVKFLRVLESRSFRRVGGEQDVSSDVRIIAATNRDSEEAINQGLLRKDLYFRIAQFPIYMPPLRDRGGDMIGLAQYFLNELNEINGTQKSLTEDFKDLVADYSWPGNVRELKSVMERAHILANKVLDAEHFPSGQMDIEDNDEYLRVSVGSSLEDAEKNLIFLTLEATDGDKKKTAEQLGISLKTLYNKLNSYKD